MSLAESIESIITGYESTATGRLVESDAGFSIRRDERLPDGRWIKYSVVGNDRNFVILTAASIDAPGRQHERYLEQAREAVGL